MADAREPGRAHRCDMRLERRLGLGVDHRPDVGRRIERVAKGELRRRPFDHGEDVLGHVLLQAEEAKRRAALPGRAEGGSDDVVGHLLGERGGIDDHGVDAAGLGDEGDDRPALLRQRPVDRPCDLGRAGEGDAGGRGVGDERRSDRSVARRKLRRRLGHAGPVEELEGAEGDERRLLGRLRHHGIAGGERRGRLAEEDGERKVPRRDGYEDAARPVAEEVALAGRPRHRHRLGEKAAGLGGIVAAEVDRFPDLGNAVVERPAALAGDERDEAVARCFEELGEAVEGRGALDRRHFRPAPEAGRRPRHHLVDRFKRRLQHAADAGLSVGGARHRAGLAAALRLRQRVGGDRRCACRPDPVEEGGKVGAGAELHPLRVQPRRLVEVARQGDAHVADMAALAERLGGTDEQGLDRHRAVAGDRDEGGVGAVLQKPAHEIGEQIAVAADRRIDAAGDARVAPHRVVERFPHAVEPLELVARAVAGHLDNGGDGQRVVAGELRIEPRPCREEPLRAGEVGLVGRRLPCEHGIVGEAALLCPLHLGVPVGALDEADHQPPAERGGEVDRPVDHGDCALLVGLDGEAEAVPAGERGIGSDGGNHVERQLQPVGLLGVDGEVEVVPFRRAGEVEEARGELGHHALALYRLVARVEGRELDRDAGTVGEAPLPRRLADRRDRLRVALEVAQGVGAGPRPLAEHVVGVAEALGLAATRPLQRLADGLAEDEVVAEHAHRLARRGPHRRPAETLDEAGDDRVRGLAGPDDPARQAERPGRGEHQPGLRMGGMVGPVAAAELVLDQAVLGRRVGDAEERLGEHHQRQALAGRQAELAEEILEPADDARLPADRGDETGRAAVDRRFGLVRKAQVAADPPEERRVVLRIGGVESRKRRFRGHGASLPRFPCGARRLAFRSPDPSARLRASKAESGTMAIVRSLVVVVGALLVAACSSEESGPYLEIQGGGFMFNYRIAEATAGIVAYPLRTLPEGGTIEASFQNPAGGEPIRMSAPVEAGKKKYDFTTPPLQGVKANTGYTMTVRLLDASGKEIETLKKPLVSDLDQSVLPSKPLTVGPGYAKNPEAQAPAAAAPAN